MNILTTCKFLGLSVSVAMGLAACSSTSDVTESASEAVCTEAYDWHDFLPNAQCVGGVEAFYTKHFGMSSSGIPGLKGYATQGACESPGACLIWLDNVPDAKLWERVTGTPQLFDMIVYPPRSGNPYGHVAVVDHVTNGTVYVMDDNYVGAGEKASCAHTVPGWTPYGAYRLRSLASSGVDCSQRSGWNCGDDGVINGNANTNYDCEYGQVAPLATQVCAYGCKTMPNGVADVCNAPPTPDCSKRSGWNCGNDGVVNGNADTNYYCKLGQVAPVESVVCTYGCVVMPNGTEDHCQAK